MNKKKLFNSLMAMSLSATLMYTGYLAYSQYGDNKTGAEKNMPSTLLASETGEGALDIQEIVLPEPEEKPIDATKVEITAEATEKLKLTGKNAGQNLESYKKALVQMDVPTAFSGKLNELITQGQKVENILPAYNFLYDNYGTIDELNGLVVRLEAGGKLGELIKEYNSSHQEFVPSDFEPSYLEDLLKTMTIDDVMIADRLSQKGLASFEDLRAKRESGLSWKEINAGLGVLNSAEELPRLSLTKAQVNKCMQDNGLSEEEALDVLILTWQTGQDYAAVSSDLKRGKQKEQIQAEAYTAKYK